MTSPRSRSWLVKGRVRTQGYGCHSPWSLPPVPSGPRLPGTYASQELCLYQCHFILVPLTPLNEVRGWLKAIVHSVLSALPCPPDLGLVAPKGPVPTRVPEASLHGHCSKSPCPRWPKEPLHFPAVAGGPAAGLGWSVNHLTEAGCPCHRGAASGACTLRK